MYTRCSERFCAVEGRGCFLFEERIVCGLIFGHAYREDSRSQNLDNLKTSHTFPPFPPAPTPLVADLVGGGAPRVIFEGKCNSEFFMCRKTVFFCIAARCCRTGAPRYPGGFWVPHAVFVMMRGCSPSLSCIHSSLAAVARIYRSEDIRHV